MPSVIKPRLLHILCDNKEYEQSLFQHIDSPSSLQTIGTNLKPGSNNYDEFSISFDVTTYESYRLHMLGNFKPWLNNITKPNTYPTLKHPVHVYDYDFF